MRIKFMGFEVIFLDIEASALGKNSFPIEIGFVLDDEVGPGAFLIAPHETWDTDGGWSNLSAEMHGIDLETLEEEGLSVDEACARLDEFARDRLLVSERHETDDWWLRRLYEAAGREKSWSIGNVEFLYGALAQQAGIAQAEKARLLTFVEELHPHPHRAGPDALRMAKSARALVDGRFRIELMRAHADGM